MNNYQDFTVLRFTTSVKDDRTGETFRDTIVLSKQQLQAAQIVGQSSKELISRLYAKKGLTVLAVIGKAERRTVPLDLDGIFREVIVD